MELYDLKVSVKKHSDLINHVREKMNFSDENTTCDYIINDFREGKLGHLTLDEINLE